jgi:hypothetical protein
VASDIVTRWFEVRVTGRQSVDVVDEAIGAAAVLKVMSKARVDFMSPVLGFVHVGRPFFFVIRYKIDDGTSGLAGSVKCISLVMRHAIWVSTESLILNPSNPTTDVWR